MGAMPGTIYEGRRSMKRVAFFSESTDHLVHVLLADLCGFGLHHDTDQRLSSALSQEQSSVAAQSLLHISRRLLHVLVAQGRRLVGHPHILKDLGQDGHLGSQSGQSLLLFQHHFHDL